MLVATEQSLDFLNSFLHMGRYKVIKVKTYDEQSRYTRHQTKLFLKNPYQSLLDKIMGEDWIEIGTMKTSIVDDFELITLSLNYSYSFAHDELKDLACRAVRMAALLGKIPKNTQVQIIILPPPYSPE